MMLLRSQFRRSGVLASSMRKSENFQVGDLASVDKWIKTISSKASTPEGKLYTSQLSSLVSFYNKAPDATELHEINWEDWNNRINTKGLVEKIKTNTQALMKEKYNVEGIATKLGGEYSDDYKRIVDRSELLYHFTLWSTYYKESVELLVRLDEIGNLNTYAWPDRMDLIKGAEAKGVLQLECANSIPGAWDDVNYMLYLETQFLWGKNQVTYYSHPTDDFRCLVSTKNILGR